MDTIRNYIDGAFGDARSGRTLEVVEPATGRVYASAPASDAVDVEDAVAAAKRAFPGWRDTPPSERSRVLLRLAELIEGNLERLALAESIDSGKPIALARRVDIPRAAANFRFFATAILHGSGEAYETHLPGMDGAEEVRAINLVHRKPRGVAGLISPWNLPLYLLTWKIAPALATGNTAVAKPSEVTPMTASLMCELAGEAGLPAGVLNIVHGFGGEAGAALVSHPEVPTISFTGGTATGKMLAAAAGPMFKRMSLELGGKNAMLVFEDADVDAAAELACRAGFTNQGQICLCASRVLVHEKLHDAFVEKLVACARRLTIGDPLEEGTGFGAVVSADHRDKVLDAIGRARREGAAVVLGGGVPGGLPERCAGGFFVEPTIVTGLSADCGVERNEIFGPVVSVSSFADEGEAVARANSTEYGLAAVVVTKDLNRAHRVSRSLEAGIVWVNCWMLRDLRTPFGGVKQSGVGREGGVEALRFFTEPTNVCIKLDESRAG